MKKNQHLILGKIGEDIACNYLKSKNYKIILRNFKKPFGEIDIVAQKKNGMLIFVEVKTLKQNSSELLPEDEMTNFKIKKLKKIVEYFTLNNSKLINQKYGWQIDLIAIQLTDDTNYIIRHYENI